MGARRPRLGGILPPRPPCLKGGTPPLRNPVDICANMKGSPGCIGQAKDCVEGVGEGPGVDEEVGDQYGFTGEGGADCGGVPPGGGGRQDQGEATFEETCVGDAARGGAAFGGLTRLPCFENCVEHHGPEHGDAGAKGGERKGFGGSGTGQQGEGGTSNEDACGLECHGIDDFAGGGVHWVLGLAEGCRSWRCVQGLVWVSGRAWQTKGKTGFGV